MNTALIGGIESGGTKFVLGIGHGNGGTLLARHSLPTGCNPADILSESIAWLRAQSHRFGPLTAIGVASFGPVDLDPASKRYGFITATPKPGWSNTDLLSPLRDAFTVPIGFDTDVNGAALAEHRWGAAQGLNDFVYLTIGTGIGGGGMSSGQVLHGLVHPEMGHLRIPRISGDQFKGVCPFHGDCWEGLCSGPAIKARTGFAAEDLPADHAAWPQIVEYTALAIANIICILSPRRVILGGSIRKAGQFTQTRFYRLLCVRVQSLMAGYVAASSLIGENIFEYIVPPLLDDDAGLIGAIELGRMAKY